MFQVAFPLSLKNSEPSVSDRNYEQTRIGQQDFAVWLRRIGVAQAVTVAGEEFATLVVGEKLQERLQRRTRKPVGDRFRPVEHEDVGRHPHVNPRRDWPQPSVVVLEFGDQGLGLGDRQQLRRPRPLGRDHPHERMRGFARVEGICTAKTPPGASVAARRGKSALWSERKSNAPLAKTRFGGSEGAQSTMFCLTNRARGARVRASSSIASDVSRPVMSASGKRRDKSSALLPGPQPRS